MKLALYVHDLRLEIGHSNSLIELVRHLPAEFLGSFSELEVVAYTCDDLEKLFPQFPGKKSFHKVPRFLIRPFLVKSLFYQLYTFLRQRIFPAQALRIGVGVSCLDVDAVSVQFIHHQWTAPGLAQERPGLRKLYKRLLFWYYERCEDFLFRRPGLRVFSPAQFLTAFLRQRYPALAQQTIYSGVNLERFAPPRVGRAQLLAELRQRYPELAALDPARPIALFVGAYERKGLARALELVAQQPGLQFVVIGRASFGRAPSFPPGMTIVRVGFTREVENFYALADAFVFPTLYEPFGLVLFEAMATGLVIVTRREQVGASELLAGLPEVHFCDAAGFHLPPIRPLPPEERRSLAQARLAKLSGVSWQQSGQALADFLAPARK